MNKYNIIIDEEIEKYIEEDFIHIDENKEFLEAYIIFNNFMHKYYVDIEDNVIKIPKCFMIYMQKKIYEGEKIIDRYEIETNDENKIYLLTNYANIFEISTSKPEKYICIMTEYTYEDDNEDEKEKILNFFKKYNNNETMIKKLLDCEILKRGYCDMVKFIREIKYKLKYEEEKKRNNIRERKLKNRIMELETHIKYMPEGVGYYEAKEHFLGLVNSYNKKN